MATKAIVPRADGEGSVGTAAKHWGAGYFDNLLVAGPLALADDEQLTFGDDLDASIQYDETNDDLWKFGVPVSNNVLAILQQADVGQNLANVPAYGHPTLAIYSAGYADFIALYHNDTDAYFKWSDGGLIIETDEATDTATTVLIRGKGTGHGVLQLYDQDNAEHLGLEVISGNAYVYTAGSSPGAIKLQHNQPQNVTLWDSITSGNPKLTLSGWDSNAAALDTYSISAAMDSGAGTKLAIGLDETMRTMVICDAGDVDADMGLGAWVKPRLVFVDSATLAWHSFLYQTAATFVIQGYSGTGGAIHSLAGSQHIYQFTVDLAAGHPFSFLSSANIELTDANARQAWMYIEPKINQTDTAAADAIYVNMTLTAEGDGSTGDGNNLLNLAVAGTFKFRVDNTGGIFPAGMKSGTDQANAGAAAGELYQDTNDDNTIKIGV